MKKLIYSFIALLLSASISAQAPESFKYQAVARNASGNVITSQTVRMQVSILQGSISSTPVYSETFMPTTNQFGLINLEIGNGTVVSGTFSGIDWSSDRYFIKIEMDATGGTSFTEMGTSQLLSVPYALHARTVELVDYSEIDPVFNTSVAKGITGVDTAAWNAKLDSFSEADPVFSTSIAKGITEADTAAWNAKLDSFSETDPIFGASVASGITADDTTRWGKTELPIATDGNILTYDGNNWVAKDLVLTTNNTGSGLAVNNMQPSLALNYCICLAGIFPSRNSAQPFIGEIQLFAFNFTPRNFASCSGQLLAINQYTALFALVGTYYGGDGRTTFGLPDLRGRTPISFGSGPGLSSRQIGQKIGDESTTITIANLPSHKHTVNISFED